MLPGVAMLSVTMNVVLAACNALPSDVTAELAKMTSQVVMNHFSESKCIGLITEDDDIVDYLHPIDMPVLHVQVSETTYRNSEALPSAFEAYAWDKYLLGPMDSRCLAFVIQTSDLEFMVKTFTRLAHSPESSQRASRKFLYIPAKEISSDIFETKVQELYSKRDIDFMPDTVIAKLMMQEDWVQVYEKSMIQITGDNKTHHNIELITHRFIGPNPSERVSLDVWIQGHGFKLGADLYPDKVMNLMGKQISLTAIFYPPLSVVFENMEPPVYDGIEFSIIHELAKQNNLTWRVVYEPDEWWGAIWENGSGTGLSGHVSMDKSDIGFGAIYLWENEYRFTDYSTLYFRTCLTAVLPRPKLLPGWTVPILPFSLSMWYGVAVSVLVSSTVLYVISKSSMHFLGRGRGKVVVNMYSTWVGCAFRTMGLLVLQVPPDERDYSTPRHVPMRHLVTWLILFYFVVTTAYCGGLASVLTLPRYESPIETPTEMADHDVIWGGMDVAYVFFLQNSYDPKMRKLAENFVEATEEYLSEKATIGDMGFVIERMQNGHFFLPSFINEKTMKKLRVMKESYVYGHCVFMMRKGSPYKDIINSIVRKVRDTGLVLYWEDNTVRNYMSTRRQLSVINSRKDLESGPTKLMLRHLTGSFYILTYGLSVSVAIFVIELFTHIYSQLKNKMTRG